MTRPAIFQFIENQLLNQKVKVLTPLKAYSGTLQFIDAEGNLKLITDCGVVLVIRKYIVSVEGSKND